MKGLIMPSLKTRKRTHRLLALCLLCLCFACTAHPLYTQASSQGSSRVQPPSTKAQQGSSYQMNQTFRGGASWYGPGFHGKATASGAIFDQNAMTAAHRLLPLGTWIQVRNLNNNRKVEVLINDRGPFKGGRILDLSKEAARRLDFLQQGTTEVEIRILTLP
jgi:rare lipoprotein A